LRRAVEKLLLEPAVALPEGTYRAVLADGRVELEASEGAQSHARTQE
jgi:hypothetical protein